MFDYLIDHAIKNVWCNPSQDNQVIIAPKRLTAPEGAVNTVKVMWDAIQLPDLVSFYHVFQIGNLPPVMLGLLDVKNSMSDSVWVSMSSVSNLKKFISNIYTDSGVQIPRHEVFYTYVNSDLVVAIKSNPNIPIDYTTDSVYIRFYTNAYFSTTRFDPTVDGTAVAGMTVKTITDIGLMVDTYHSYQAKVGYTQAFVNGYLVNDLTGVSVALGDTVEVVYDSSVIKVVNYRVGALPIFDSILDNKSKYLLHYADDHLNRIEYHDDNDYYIVDGSTGNRFNGIYYHKNAVDAVRMVTHRDYSIVPSYVAAYAEKLRIKGNLSAIDIGQLTVRCVIRKSGYNRPLVPENNRLMELYKLPDSEVLLALSGTNSTVPNWLAPNLENSDYSKLMAAKYSQVTRSMVESAYGYNAVAKAVANTPMKPFSRNGIMQVDIPYGLQASSTVYEYDSAGKMLGWYLHASTSVYTTVNATCALVEILAGTGSSTPDNRFGKTNIALPVGVNYRVYLSHQLTPTTYDDKWVDVTGDSTKYTVTNNTLFYTGNETNQFFMVRTDSKFLAYNTSVSMINGNLGFNLVEIQDRGTGPVTRAMTVPMGELEIFMNDGRSLIDGLDYIVNFPAVTILNKQYLTTPDATPQTFHIRFCGFCNSSLVYEKPNEAGFGLNGYLSTDTKFDIRDDLVSRVVVGGGVFLKTDLPFNETSNTPNNLLNGLPFTVRDIVVPLGAVANTDTYAFRTAARAIDQVVSDYMTSRYPVINRGLGTIPSKYPIYSPFISTIIKSLMSNAISTTVVTSNYSDIDVLAACAPYETLLPFDPIRADHAVNGNFVIIHPHYLFTPVTLNVFQYRFLQRVLALYANGLIDLTGFITVVPI